jgi:uncharacterized damage-inducible protein DinB
MIEAHDAAWDGWWPSLVGLPRAQAHRRIGGSYPSVFLTARHMVETEEYWQDRLEDGEGPGGPVPRSMAQLERVWRKLRERRRRWLTRGDPSSRVRFEAQGGVPAAVTAWECLLHVVTHAHFHRGQLATQCRALGVRPPSRHLIGHFIGEF